MIRAAVVDSSGRLVGVFSVATQEDLDANTPAGCVAVEDVPDNHDSLWIDGAWVEPAFTLEQAKADTWARLKAARDAALYGGFTWSGLRFDSDETSQSRVQGAIQLASLVGPSFSTVWILADNSARTLSATDIVGVGIAMGSFAESVFAAGATLRAQVLAAPDFATLDALRFPTLT